MRRLRTVPSNVVCFILETGACFPGPLLSAPPGPVTHPPGVPGPQGGARGARRVGRGARGAGGGARWGRGAGQGRGAGRALGCQEALDRARGRPRRAALHGRSVSGPLSPSTFRQGPNHTVTQCRAFTSGRRRLSPLGKQPRRSVSSPCPWGCRRARKPYEPRRLSRRAPAAAGPGLLFPGDYGARVVRKTRCDPACDRSPESFPTSGRRPTSG